MFKIRGSYFKRKIWKQIFSQIELSEKFTNVFRDKILRNPTLNLPSDRKLLTSSATPTTELSSYGIGLQATFQSPRFAFLQAHQGLIDHSPLLVTRLINFMKTSGAFLLCVLPVSLVSKQGVQRRFRFIISSF